MAGTPAAFAPQFYEHLRPRLTRLCVALARCIAAEVETFDGAYDTVWHYARKYGAAHLSWHEQDELREWIARGILDAVLEAEAAGWGDWLERNRIGPGARV